MFEKVLNCPVCNNTDIRNSLICKDFTVSEESFAITECKSCGLKITNPRPTPPNISKYYDSQDYISHTNASNNLINLAYKFVRLFTLGNKFNLLKKYVNHKGKLLDYGCGTGQYLEYCKNKGWTVVGVEPNTNAAKNAKSLGIQIYNTLEQLQDNEKYDVITLWHVLEHVHDLKSVIETLKNRLNKNGIICVAVPNTASYDCGFYKQHWAAYDVPRHLYHFNQDSFRNFAKKIKMKIVDVLPMKFDSFYVSMLSEKNLSGKNNYSNAFKMGLKSNKWAKENNGNYSSLIYILKK
ncbi:MAG: class I SAM-dependent methyltransferase [Bacteroidota bacterium]|nr:class I SAM-dependent methyltransferase [Bacteroidota bacterium]